MPLRVQSSQEMPIETEDDVVLVRRAVRRLAEARGFDSFASAALTTAVTELSRNIWVHARRGRVLIQEVWQGEQAGVRVEFRDEGPGIANLEQALAGGKSTAGSLGLGLPGSRRLVDQFHIESTVGRGTTVQITKWKRY